MEERLIWTSFFLLGGFLGWLFVDLTAKRRSHNHLSLEDLEEDEAETDRFLAEAGRVYREELARKIAEECERRIDHIDDIDLELLDFRELVYKEIQMRDTSRSFAKLAMAALISRERTGTVVDPAWIASTAWKIAMEMEKEANRLDGMEIIVY